MGRPLRVDVGGYVYHVVNRANARMTIFEHDSDYAAFERIVDQAQSRTDMRLLAWCVMPNHWHMVVWPCKDGDLARFVGWLTLTHTQRWHAHRHTAGEGHVYQGRYKSFLIEAEAYLCSACRYVERNALRAGLVKRAEDWRWGSAWRWANRGKSLEGLPTLSDWPTPSGGRPRHWLQRVNQPESQDDLAALRQCLQRGRPYGPTDWVQRIAGRLNLTTTLRPRGRPRCQPSPNTGRASIGS